MVESENAAAPALALVVAVAIRGRQSAVVQGSGHNARGHKNAAVGLGGVAIGPQGTISGDQEPDRRQ